MPHPPKLQLHARGLIIPLRIAALIYLARKYLPHLARKYLPHLAHSYLALILPTPTLPT